MLPARKEMVHTTRVLSNSPRQNDSPKSFKKRGFHKYQTLLTCLFLREVMPKAARVLASTNPRMKCQHSSGSSKDTSILGLAGRRKGWPLLCPRHLPCRLAFGNKHGRRLSGSASHFACRFLKLPPLARARSSITCGASHKMWLETSRIFFFFLGLIFPLLPLEF